MTIFEQYTGKSFNIDYSATFPNGMQIISPPGNVTISAQLDLPTDYTGKVNGLASVDGTMTITASGYSVGTTIPGYYGLSFRNVEAVLIFVDGNIEQWAITGRATEGVITKLGEVDITSYNSGQTVSDGIFGSGRLAQNLDDDVYVQSQNENDTGTWTTLAPIPPPVISAPTSATVEQGTATPISGVSLSEIGNAAGEIFTVSLTDATGDLSASPTGGDDLVSGSGTTSLAITGTLSQVNSDLATLTDTDATSSSDTITIYASDSFGNNAGPKTITAVIETGLAGTLSLTVEDTNIGATAASAVAFTIAGLDPEDSGTVTFTDQNNQIVQVSVYGDQTDYTANLSGLADGIITSSLAVGSSTPVAGNLATLDQDLGEQAALNLTVAETAVRVEAASAAPFAIAGLDPEDTGAVTFTDSNNKTVQISVNGGQTNYTANLTTLAAGPVTSSLAVADDPAGNSSVPVGGKPITLYNEANVTLYNGANFASEQDTFRVGEAGDGFVTVQNTAPAPYSENLVVNINGTAGSVVSASDPLGDIAPQNTDTVSYTVDTSEASSGDISLQFESDGTGIDNAGVTPIGTTDFKTHVDNFAMPEIDAEVPRGDLSGARTIYTLNLGTTYVRDPEELTAYLKVKNSSPTESPSDALDGTFLLPEFTSFSNNGFAPLIFTSAADGGISAGDAADVGNITLPTGTSGRFTETIYFDPMSHNVNEPDFPLPTIQLLVEGTILGPSDDFRANGMSDLLWQNTDGTPGIWLMNGTTPIAETALPNPGPTWQIIGTGDFNGSGKADILWQNSDGTPGIWLMNGTTPISETALSNPGSSWQIIGTGDFTGNGLSDILWQQGVGGDLGVWLMNGSTPTAEAGLGNPGANWKAIGAADFTGNRVDDILLQNTATGNLMIDFMSGTTITSSSTITVGDPSWHVVDVGEDNGEAEILFQNISGAVGVWLMNGATPVAEAGLGNPGSGFQLIAGGDFTGHGPGDLLFQNTNGTPMIWEMNGTSMVGQVTLSNPAPSWQLKNGDPVAVHSGTG